MELTGKELATRAAEYALEKKAADVKLLDLRDISDVADFFLICSGNSDVQVRAIADHIEMELKKKHATRVLGVEGLPSANWVLLDYVDVIIHIFLPEKRNFYGLELLWGDAAVTEFED